MNAQLITFFTIFILSSSLAQENTFKLGDQIPIIETTDIFERSINSVEMVKSKKLLIVFYRGEWCPYCRKYTSELEDKLKALESKIDVILISPEQQSFANNLMDEKKDNIYVVSDEGYKLMDLFGLKYQLSKETVPRFYNAVLQRTRKHNGNEDDVLPVPATYLIDNNHTIEYMHFDQDYRNRGNLDEILSHILELDEKLKE